MREILFRGKRVDGEHEWVYGDLITDDANTNDVMVIIHNVTQYACVEADTVGQYTGFKDRNGNKIYEADILAVDDPLLYTAYNSVAVIWLQGGWFISSDFILPMPLYLYTQCSTIIGNIFDNPELVREAKK